MQEGALTGDGMYVTAWLMNRQLRELYVKTTDMMCDLPGGAAAVVVVSTIAQRHLS